MFYSGALTLLYQQLLQALLSKGLREVSFSLKFVILVEGPNASVAPEISPERALQQ